MIIKIPFDEINKIKNGVWIHSTDTTEIDWLYNSLLKQDQSSIFCLVSVLYMDDHYPEVFNENTD